MTTHLFARPGDFPDTLCGHTRTWAAEPAVYFSDLDKVTCPECLGRVEIPTAEPYEDVTVDDDDPLLRYMPYTEEEEVEDLPLPPPHAAFFVFVLMLPFWIALLIAIWRWLT